MILISGATGSNGREVIKALAALKAPIRALVRDPSKAADLKVLGATIVKGDFDDPGSLDAALKGCERAFLISGVSERMLEQEKTFAGAAKRAGIRHLVKLSAIGVSPTARGYFIRSHGAAEKAVEQTGIPWTHLRATFFMQNMLMAADTIRKESKFFSHHKDGRAADVDVRDIAAVAARVLTDPIAQHASKAYPMTGPQPLTSDDRAGIFSKVLGRTITCVHVPREGMRQALLGARMPDWMATGATDLDEVVINGEAAKVADTIERIGRKKPITFEQFVHDNAAAFSA